MGGTLQEAMEEVETRCQRSRRREDRWVGYHPQELSEAEDRESPGRLSLSDFDKPFQGGGVQNVFTTVGGDQYVGVDGDQERFSMKS